MAVDRFGRNRPQTFPDWCDTGKQSFGGLRHTMDHKKKVLSGLLKKMMPIYHIMTISR